MITRQLLESTESLTASICLFQELIRKALELRETVIGDRVFVVAIPSQEQSQTQIDWRRHNPDLRFTVSNLPDRIERLWISYVKSYGLQFSTIDLIFTPDGQHIFLENNPNGQFLFVERRLPQLQMARHLAECLSAGRPL